MALLHEEEDHHIPQDKRKKQGAEGRQTSEPEKAHPTGEFVIGASLSEPHRMVVFMRPTVRPTFAKIYVAYAETPPLVV